MRARQEQPTKHPAHTVAGVRVDPRCDAGPSTGLPRCPRLATQQAYVDDGWVFGCQECADKNPDLPWHPIPSLLSRFAKAAGVTRHELAAACGVRVSSVDWWWYGEDGGGARVPSRHAAAIRTLLGEPAQRAVYSAFPRPIGRGRLPEDGGRSLFARAARVLRLRARNGDERAARLALELEAMTG